MRELRVIESCVQILHVPFAKGTHNFEDITQDMAITSICKLTYQLLAKIVENYQLNQIYAAQWINLYLSNVLKTTSQNQIGADSFLTLLSDQNKSILEQKFTREIIQNFITSCERSLETPRLLRLLTALCSCQGQPISSNQTDIIQILIGTESSRKKFLMLVQRKRPDGVEVCLDLTANKYVDLLVVIQQVAKIREEIIRDADRETSLVKQSSKILLSDYTAFLQLIDLLSEACLGRNAESQRIISERFELKTIQPIIEKPEYPHELRYRVLRLYLNLYLDKTF